MRSQSRAKAIVLAGDVLLSAMAISCSWLFLPSPNTEPLRELYASVIFICFTICGFYLFDLYDLSEFNGIRTIYRVAAACSAVAVSCSVIYFVFAQLSPGRGHLIISLPMLLVLVYLWRRLCRRSETICPTRKSVLVVGTAADAAAINEILNGHSRDRILGVLRTDIGEGEKFWQAAAGASSAEGQHFASVGAESRLTTTFPQTALELDDERSITSLGWASPESVDDWARELAVRSVVFRMDPGFNRLAPALARLRFRGVRIYSLPDFYMHISDRLPLDLISEEWLSCAEGFEFLHIRMLRRLKRLTDIVLSCVGLVLLSPVMLLTAIVIKCDSDGPIFIKQRRVGWKGQTFDLFKFRSMRCNAEADGKPQWAKENDPRITRVGKFIRKSRIDELPQMVNVLSGQMSFVGPRPERPEFEEQLQRLIPFYSFRHYVPPGITGWAQVRFPYGASVEDTRRKLEYDFYYIRNASPLMDLRIVAETVKVVLFERNGR